MWYDGSEYCGDDDNFFKWYDSYKKRKTQKASIKEELMPILWHPSRYWDWCMSEDEKKKSPKNCGHKHGLFLYLVTGYKKFFLSIKFNPCLGQRT